MGVQSNGHEIRFVSGAVCGAAVMLGTIDSLAPDDGVKLFGWFFVMVGLLCITFYELLNLDAEVYMKTPPGRMTALLMTEMGAAFWGLWNVVWLTFRTLAGLSVSIDHTIGIAPNLRVSNEVWVITTIAALAVLGVCVHLIDKLSHDVSQRQV